MVNLFENLFQTGKGVGGKFGAFGKPARKTKTRKRKKRKETSKEHFMRIAKKGGTEKNEGMYGIMEDFYK